jgi:hypothetical protein
VQRETHFHSLEWNPPIIILKEYFRRSTVILKKGKFWLLWEMMCPPQNPDTMWDCKPNRKDHPTFQDFKFAYISKSPHPMVFPQKKTRPFPFVIWWIMIFLMVSYTTYGILNLFPCIIYFSDWKNFQVSLQNCRYPVILSKAWIKCNILNRRETASFMMVAWCNRWGLWKV